MFRITPHYLDVRTNKQKVVDKRISAKNVFLSASRTVAVQNGQKVTKQSDFLRVSQKLRGQNFAIFWPPHAWTAFIHIAWTKTDIFDPLPLIFLSTKFLNGPLCDLCLCLCTDRVISWFRKNEFLSILFLFFHF